MGLGFGVRQRGAGSHMGVELWKGERLEPAVSFINAVVESVTEGSSVWEGVG